MADPLVGIPLAIHLLSRTAVTQHLAGRREASSFIRQPSRPLWRWRLRTGRNSNFVLSGVFVAITRWVRGSLPCRPERMNIAKSKGTKPCGVKFTTRMT
jgi:hypothetical protein